MAIKAPLVQGDGSNPKFVPPGVFKPNPTIPVLLGPNIKGWFSSGQGVGLFGYSSGAALSFNPRSGDFQSMGRNLDTSIDIDATRSSNVYTVNGSVYPLRLYFNYIIKT